MLEFGLRASDAVISIVYCAVQMCLFPCVGTNPMLRDVPLMVGGATCRLFQIYTFSGIQVGSCAAPAYFHFEKMVAGPR